MSRREPVSLRTVAFGELESQAWGVAWGLGEHAVLVASNGTAGGSTALRTDRLAATGLRDGEAGIELSLAERGAFAVPYGPAGSEHGAGADAVAVAVRICQVTGQVACGGEAWTVDCLGIDVTHTVPALEEIDSLRQVLAWFSSDDTLAVSAARPRKAAGHDRDEVLAAMLEPTGPVPIEQARLSTTYGSDGVAVTMGLELWPAADDQFPRRIAGEADGGPGVAPIEGGRLEVHPMRCHRAGRDGLGVYLLARPEPRR